MSPIELYRIDGARNMSRFYRLEMQPDLFGGVLLVRQWGRIGARGRIVAERFDDATLAADALRRQADRKRRRGYSAAYFPWFVPPPCAGVAPPPF